MGGGRSFLVIVILIGDPAEPIVRQAEAFLEWRCDAVYRVDETGKGVIGQVRQARVSQSMCDGRTTLQVSRLNADLVVAPLLTRKLTPDDLAVPRYGTLVFHPSLLPRHRGPDAIKAAFRANERYSGATWFWANDQYDAGDLCEQEVLEIQEGERPRDFYTRAVIPSAIKLLSYAVADLCLGHVRRRPQRAEAMTYEPRRL